MQNDELSRNTDRSAYCISNPVGIPVPIFLFQVLASPLMETMQQNLKTAEDRFHILPNPSFIIPCHSKLHSAHTVDRKAPLKPKN
jgi:hypothetical protein